MVAQKRIYRGVFEAIYQLVIEIIEIAFHILIAVIPIVVWRYITCPKDYVRFNFTVYEINHFLERLDWQIATTELSPFIWRLKFFEACLNPTAYSQITVILRFF